MAGATVTVASKLPTKHTLRLCIVDDAYEPVVGGGQRKFKQARFVGGPDGEVVLNGTAVRPDQTRDHPLSNGYALTRNVPADFWDKWCEQNKGSGLLTEGVIFAVPKLSDMVQETKRNKDVRSGLEPINPKEKHRFGSHTVQASDDMDMNEVDGEALEALA